MPNTKFSALDTATPEDADAVVGLKGGVGKRFLFSAIKTYIAALLQGPGDAIADEEVVRGDTAGLQGSAWYVTDTGVLQGGGRTATSPGLTALAGEATFRIIPADGSAGNGNLIANIVALAPSSSSTFLLRLDPGAGQVQLFHDGEVVFSSTAAAGGGFGASLSREADGEVSVNGAALGDGLGVLRFGGGRCRGYTTSAGAASTTEYPNDKDWGIHKNSSSGAIHLVFNNGGVIVAVQLT